MSNTKNVKLGVCSINFGGVDLGYTKGGVDVEVKTQTKEVMVDQFGNSPINEYILSRTCVAKCPLAETTLDNLARIMPGASLVATGGAKATGTVTFVTAAPVNGDSVTIGSATFTFKTTATNAETDISLTGVTTPALAAAALADAVNRDIDPSLGVVASVAAAVVTLTADDAGTAANSIALAKNFVTGTNCTVSGATLSGGTDASKRKVIVPNGVGTSLLALAQPLILHPVALPVSDRSEDFTIPLAMTAGEMQYSYKLDQERIFTCSFTAYPDSVTKTLFVVGDSTAA